jgi:hypothetical protein
MIGRGKLFNKKEVIDLALDDSKRRAGGVSPLIPDSLRAA